MTLQEKLYQVRERIQKAAARSKRNPAEVTVVLVTKNVLPEKIREAFEAGARDFGENRVQELLAKKPELPPEICWHFQGHLQTNKVKDLLKMTGPDGKPPLLHSLDRIALAEEIEKQAQKRNLKMEALVQVNTTGKATQSGFSPSEVEEAFQKLKTFDRICLTGLMTIGPWTEDQDLIRKSFRTLRSLRDRLGLTHLSMGMSQDFELAIEEGATIVRIGTAVFGERRPQSTVDRPQ